MIDRVALRRARKISMRLWREASLPLVALWLRVRNLCLRRKVIDPTSDVLVSLTSHGPRLRSVYLTIESIAAGKLRPARIILWVNDAAFIECAPRQIDRLTRRGLEVRVIENFGPHCKYYGSLSIARSHGLRLATADDDIVYPRNWLQILARTAALRPSHLVTYMSRLMEMQDGVVPPYAEWPQNWSSEARESVFMMGVSGAIYPDRLICALEAEGTSFMHCAPRADDVWLNFIARREGIPISQVSAIPAHFAQLRIRGPRLSADNVDAGRNDSQIRATFGIPVKSRREGGAVL